MIRRRRKERRFGSTAVEFAFVAPIFFAIIFAIIEFGRAGMTIHMLEGAAREGCRMAILEGATETEVKAKVTDVLSNANIKTHRTEVTSLPTAAQWDPITVEVEVDHDDISWLPLPKYFDGKKLIGPCTLPKESG